MFRSRFVSFVFSSALAVFSLSAHAEGEAGSTPNPYVDCGIGGALFPTIQWAAVLSNAIWDLGTTALSSATMSPETCSGKQKDVAQFIIDNYDNLLEETAKGQGQHLSALMDISECQGDSRDVMVSSLRSKLSEVVSNNSYNDLHLVEKSYAYYSALNSAQLESDACLI